MTHWTDSSAVEEQYRSETNLRARQALSANVEGSLSYESQPVPDDVALPFRVHGRTTIFVATK
jgi:hypothetical protein